VREKKKTKTKTKNKTQKHTKTEQIGLMNVSSVHFELFFILHFSPACGRQFIYLRACIYFFVVLFAGIKQEVKGLSMHQDFGGCGTAVPDRANELRVTSL
jgi:hypothetical protein